ncbi:hypothetical protein HXX76_000906 [Chlamydomonas incerta]|uniref:MYND-type domain-containing protein n=1 Tax=Chlamydomonas incerta TaxID=51695 RepID=A0A836B3H0_CHLIN|nr:hypothetical protein HXX76_000906 [Chlamydomonas incerta]|eukprot:KAG2446318.1 hypothetical protein HXX76_000906 [Chlamydomonas incerta]
MFARLIGQVSWLAGLLLGVNLAHQFAASLPDWLGEEVGDLHAFLLNPAFILASMAAVYGQRLYGMLAPAEAEALPALSLAWYGQAVRGPRALLALLLLYLVRTTPRRLQARKRTGPVAFGRALVAFERAAACMTRSQLSTAARRAVAANVVGTDRVLLHELRVESLAGAKAANALHRAAELSVAEEVGMPPIYPTSCPPKKVRLAADLSGLLLTRSRAAAEAAPRRSMVEVGEAVLARMAALLAEAAAGGGGGRAAAATANPDEFRAAVLRSAYTGSRLVSTSAVILFRLCQGLRRGGVFAPAEVPVATARRNSLLAQMADSGMMGAWAGLARTLAAQPSRCPPALLHLASPAPAAPPAPAALAAHELHWAVLGDAGRYLRALVHAAAIMCDKDREAALLAAHLAAAGQEPGTDEDDEEEGDEEEEEEGRGAEGAAGGRRRGRVTGALAAEALVDALESSGLLEALCAALLAATATHAAAKCGLGEQLAVPPEAAALLRQEAAAAREAAGQRVSSAAEGTGRASSNAATGGGKAASTPPAALAALQYMYATSNLAISLIMLTNLAGALPRMAGEIGAAAVARRKARAAAGKAPPPPVEDAFSVVKATELSKRTAALLLGPAVQRLQRCLLERFSLDQLEQGGGGGAGEGAGEPARQDKSAGGGKAGAGGGGGCGWVLLDAFRMQGLQAQQMQRLDTEVVSADIDESGSADAPRLTLLEPALSMWAAQSVGLAGGAGAGGSADASLPSMHGVVRAIGRAMRAVHVLLTSSDCLDLAALPTGSRYTATAIAAASALAGTYKRFATAPDASAASTRAFAVDAMEAVAWTLAVGTRAVSMELMAGDEEEEEEEEDGGGGGGGAGGRRQQGLTELGLRPVAYPLQVFRHMAEAHGEGFRKLPAADQAALARRLAAAHWPASLDLALRLGARSLARSGLRVANVPPGAGGPGAEVVRGVTCLLPSLSVLVCTPAAAPWAEAVADEAAAGAGGLLVSMGKLAAWLGTQVGRRGLPLTAAKPDGEDDDDDEDEDGEDSGAKGKAKQQQPAAQPPPELGGGEASALFDAMAGGLWQLVGTGALQPLGLAMPAGATSAAAGSLAGGAALALGTSAEAAAELRGAVAYCLRGLCRAAAARAFAAAALPNGNAAAAQQRNTALGGTGACATWLGAPLAGWLPAPRDLLPARPERLLAGVGVLLGRCFSDGGVERGALAGWSHAAAGSLLALAAHERLSGDVQGWLLAGSGAGGAGSDAGSSFSAGMGALCYVLRAAGMQQDMDMVERLRAAAASAPREAGGGGSKAAEADAAGPSASGAGAKRAAGGSAAARNRAGRGAAAAGGGGGRAAASAPFCEQAQQLLKEWNARAPKPAGGGAAAAASPAAASGAGVEVAPAKACANPRCGRFGGPTEASLKPMQCSGCRTARYCCPGCQLEHWKAEGHKQECARSG